jgi:CubicO group peptidase (beta-lactamase class C family)
MTAQSEIDSLLRHAASSGDVPGVVAMAASDRGVIYEGTFGQRDLATGVAMTKDTVFRIASMTKAVTCVAAMQLVEEGLIELDAPLSALGTRISATLTAPQVLEGFDAEGRPRLRPAKRPITLRHLLSHTAGFVYAIWNADIQRYVNAMNLPSTTSAKRGSLDQPLLFDPGERWEYGINIDWTGHIVEALRGASLDAILRERIFTPLGMTDTCYVPSDEQCTRLVGIAQREADGSLKPLSVNKPTVPEIFLGGAGLHSTAGDYLRFVRMLLAGGALEGSRILRPETVALMHGNHTGDLPAGVLKTAMPVRSNDVDLFPGRVTRWSLGHMLNVDGGANGRAPGSVNWGGVFNSYYWIDPVRRVTGVMMTQVQPFADARVLATLGGFERAVYEATVVGK